MNKEFTDLFEIKGSSMRMENGDLIGAGERILVRADIPRFTPDHSYSTNFALLRREHARLQLDSCNGTTDRYETILSRTGWPADFFKDKLVLECGCGAGPDTEILSGLGAKVLSVDIAGVDVAKANMHGNGSVQFVQADISDLPLKKHAFDIVFCHRVLQHTPDPEMTLRHILGFVKQGGAIFVHSYAKTFFQKFRWKYWLLPFTSRMRPEVLYSVISAYAKPLFYITNLFNRTRIGRRLCWIFLPLLNYSQQEKFRTKTPGFLLEYAIHDTFDALSSKYDRPLSAKKMKEIASAALSSPFEIVSGKTITLLRSVIDVRQKKSHEPV